MKKIILIMALAATFFALSDDANAAKLKGKVKIDGSSTVYPITEAVAEEFGATQPRVRVTIGVSGTGGGFKKFAAGETDINDASRPMKQKEIDKAITNGINYIEIPVAYDGLSVLVNPANDFCTSLSVEELHRIWMPGSTVMTWQDVRPEWPDRKIKLYGPGVDSGTFDYFTHAINGESQACRADFTASEDDNVLVQGIAGDKDALGFFGFAYYVENADKLKLVAVDNGAGAIKPSQQTINDGSYAPLSRPIFIYVSAKSAERPEIVEFINFYLENASTLVPEVGYVALPDAVYASAQKRFEMKMTGSVFSKAEKGLLLQDIYKIQ